MNIVGVVDYSFADIYAFPMNDVAKPRYTGGGHMANSRRHVDVIFFCLISLWGFIPHSTFAENPITAPPSITTSGVVEQSLDNINMPDPTEASKALVAVIPDSASLIKNYTGLMEIVRSAQGELDLSVLYDACTGCHRWHSDVIADKRKDLAILEWMSQKIWEMAGTPEKKQLLERYIGDVGRLMDEGKIHPLMGLKLTTYTMATRFVGSDVHTDALLNLFKRYMKTGNTKVDDFICYEFMVTTSAFLSEGIRSSDIVEILRQNYPTKNFPKDPLQFSYPPIPIWRKTYDDIMQLSPSELHKKIITPSDTIEKNYSCEVALARMLDLYDQDPREVKATIVDLLDKGLLMDTIPACLFSIPFYGQKVNKAHPIMLSDDMIELILSKY